MIPFAALAWFLVRGSLVITFGYAFFLVAVRYWKIDSPSLRQFTCVAILGIACCPWSMPVNIVYTPAIETSVEPSQPAVAPLASSSHSSESNPLSTTSTNNIPQGSSDELTTLTNPTGAAATVSWQRGIMQLTRLAWPLGGLGCFLLGVLRYGMFVYRLNSCGAHACTALPAWQSQWQALLREHGVQAKVPFLASDEHGPMLAWLVRGYRLIVPHAYWQSLSLAERRGILLHELAHYLRGDILSACLLRLLALPFWFHPLAWRLVAEFEEAAEWACDRAVLQRGEPLAYAKALERLVESNLPNFSLAMGRCAQSHPLVSRVRRVLNPVSNEDSLMKKFLFSAALGGVALLALVNIRLVAQDQADANLQKVLEDVKRIEGKISELKDTAEKAKAVAQELKDRVDQHLEKIKALATGTDVSADGKRRIELAQSGDEAKQLQALDGAEKLSDEGLLICGYLAKEANSETVRRKALSLACSLGEAGLPVLAHSFESLATKDRMFLIEQLAKENNELNRIVLARIAQDENEEVSTAAVAAGMKMKEPLLFLALVGEKKEKLVSTILANLSTFSTDDQHLLLFAAASKGPADLLPKIVQAAGKLKSQGYPIIAAAYKRNTPEARAEIVRLFRKSTEPIEQRVVQEALKDGDATLREAAEKANAE